jgi:hypothetical protein
MNRSNSTLENNILLTEQEQGEVKAFTEMIEECLRFLESGDYESIIKITRIKTIAILTDWRLLHTQGNLGILSHTFSFFDINADEDVALLGALDQVNTLWEAWQRERILTIKGKFFAVIHRLKTVCDRIMIVFSVSPIPTRTYIDNEGECRVVADVKKIFYQKATSVPASEKYLSEESLKSLIDKEIVFCPAAKNRT